MYRVMIVDDEPLMQSSIRQYLEQKMPEYQITAVCRNGIEALDTFRSSPADIVMIDIRMPLMTGLELIEKLNQLGAYYVPIVISSYSEFTYAKTAMGLGAAHYLLKPIDYHELEQALEAASHKISYHRLICSPIHERQDKQEIYLLNLIRGYPSDKTASSFQFRQLNFPFTYENSPGILLKTAPQQPFQWAYGKEGLSIALGTILRMTLQPDYLICVSCSENHCEFLLIGSVSDDVSLDKFVTQAQEMLSMNVAVSLLFSFSSLEELRTVNCQKLIPDLEYDVTQEDNLQEKSMIQKAIAYINEHYNEDISRDEISSKVYMSGAHFSRCFKKETGMTFSDYITDLRMRKAIELLQTNCKIQDISKKLGYSSQNRFIINFKHYTSYTPSEYRKNVLKIE